MLDEFSSLVLQKFRFWIMKRFEIDGVSIKGCLTNLQILDFLTILVFKFSIHIESSYPQWTSGLVLNPNSRLDGQTKKQQKQVPKIGPKQETKLMQDFI